MDRQTERALTLILEKVSKIEARINEIDSGMDYLMSTGEVAQVLGTTPKTVRNWVNEGRLIAVYVPDNLHAKYRRSDVQAFMKNLRGKKKC